MTRKRRKTIDRNLTTAVPGETHESQDEYSDYFNDHKPVPPDASVEQRLVGPTRIPKYLICESNGPVLGSLTLDQVALMGAEAVGLLDGDGQPRKAAFIQLVGAILATNPDFAPDFYAADPGRGGDSKTNAEGKERPQVAPWVKAAIKNICADRGYKEAPLIRGAVAAFGEQAIFFKEGRTTPEMHAFFSCLKNDILTNRFPPDLPDVRGSEDGDHNAEVMEALAEYDWQFNRWLEARKERLHLDYSTPRPPSTLPRKPHSQSKE